MGRSTGRMAKVSTSSLPVISTSASVPSGGNSYRQSPGPNYKTDEQLRNFIKNEAWGHHASCTNKMGPRQDGTAVVDSKFRVHGTQGLRIVDASVFPRIPGLFIVVPIYMAAEKASEDILADARASTATAR